LEAVPVNLIADRDGAPVGMVSVTAVVDQEAEIISMWVAPTARGQGIADRLVCAALEHARALGAKRVALDVTAGNEHALDLYRRSGFRDVGWSTHPDAARPERRMQLDLQLSLSGAAGK